MFQEWSKSDPEVVQQLSNCVPTVVQKCYNTAPTVIQTWFNCGPRVVQQNMFGTLLLTNKNYLWSTVGTIIIV
eukprot:9467725-Heterocapsa_arctica.AAC.1